MKQALNAGVARGLKDLHYPPAVLQAMIAACDAATQAASQED